MPRSALGTTIVFALVAGVLLAAGRRDYPELHVALDTAMFLLSAVLAMLLWDIGARSQHALATWLAIAFAATSALELIHVAVAFEWSGPLSIVAESRNMLRPATWPPTAHILPIAIGISIALWLRGVGRPATVISGVALASAVLFAAFQGVPAYSQAQFLGISRPTLILAPVLWVAVGIGAWRIRSNDRVLLSLAIMAAVMCVGNVAMLYSTAPHDTAAMVAHFGRVCGELIVLFSLMHMASADMLERIRAEQELARANESLERRVLERTTQLEEANRSLEDEVAVRRQTEAKLQAQLVRLDLLQRVTRAIGERQDLDSIFQVVVRTVEEQMPADFCLLCLHDRIDNKLVVSRVGAGSGALAHRLGLSEHSSVEIDRNGLSRCISGDLVYEPDIRSSRFAFPAALARGGLTSLVVAPLQVESEVFGVLATARARENGFSSNDCEFLRQLSEHVALAAHQARLNGALQTAYDDLRQTQQTVMQQERLRALGQMASGIAHDINNALSPVPLYVESLLERETSLSARARGQLETIQRAVNDVAQTVDRMREFYRGREPRQASAPVDLNDLVRQVVDLTRARWNDMPLKRGIVIRVATELESFPQQLRILAVESEIREALTNLVFNAVDALPEGGTLRLQTRSIHDAAHRGQILLEVVDSGIGMDAATRERCLEPFFTTKGERGTGLGLAMVYGTAQRHGATVEIESAPGIGTTVRLTFPAASTQTAADPVEARLPTRLRLLVIDDDPVVLKSLADILEADGHEVVTADSGKTGLERFRAGMLDAKPFAAVITDLGMPYVDGRRVAAAVKEAVPAMPVIMLTGWGQRLVGSGEIPPHVDEILSKPPQLRELRNALARACDRATS